MRRRAVWRRRRAAERDAIGGAADEEVDLAAFGELEFAGVVGAPSPTFGDAEAAGPTIVSSVNCASRITAAGGGGGGGRIVAAIAAITTAAAGDDQCGGRRLQQQALKRASCANWSTSLCS